MKYLSLSAIVYAALFGLNLFYGNAILITIQGVLGAALFVACAVYINALDDENNVAHIQLEKEVNQLKKQIDELKQYQAKS